MIIKDLSKKENGSYSFQLEVTQEETQALLHFAVNQLIIAGLIDIGQDDDLIFDEIDDFINKGGKLS